MNTKTQVQTLSNLLEEMKYERDNVHESLKMIEISEKIFNIDVSYTIDLIVIKDTHGDVMLHAKDGKYQLDDVTLKEHYPNQFNMLDRIGKHYEKFYHVQKIFNLYSDYYIKYVN